MEIPSPPKLRIGNGFDIHPVSNDPSRPLILGGVEVSSGFGLLGHSDADVVCHAVSDAVLGAVGLGGIGDHFPDDDPSLEGANSLMLLSRCVQMAAEKGWYLINADVTVIAQQPHLSGFLVEISSSVSLTVSAPVSVKAKSPERIGSLGDNLGMVALASALLWQP
ncbi:MAG: 2-C-methyl-D-erythritol 2,4-cyclodiphosphate synthase [Actinomycetota bacterium]|nr:2-C-methyl-D-erythritol 2,4-cyclodiphosphate synthase [Actinomycetota bacterium]